MIESDRRSFFRPTVVIYDKILHQLQLMNSVVKQREDRNRLTPNDFNELVEYLEQRDLLARPFLIAIRSIFDTMSNGQTVNKTVFEQARRRLDSYRKSYLLGESFVGVEGDYEIYRVSNTLHAVHRCFRPALVERLRYLDHVEQPPIVFTASDRAELKTRISEAGVGLDWNTVPASLMRFCTQQFNQKEPQFNHADSAESAASVDYEKSLRTAQRELTAVYKSKKRSSLRLAAWGTVLGLKLSKWLAAKEVAA